MLGRVDLGLAEHEYWRLSPRLLVRLSERHRELKEIERLEADYRAGVSVAVFANWQPRDMRVHPEPYEPSDFYPSLPRVERESKEQDWEDQLVMMKAWTAVMDGGFG